MDSPPIGEGSDSGRSREQLTRLLVVARQRRALKNAEPEFIELARQEGWTLAEIGRALGVSRQAVHAKLRRGQRTCLALGALIHLDDSFDAICSLLI
jgi:DNA-directed RNA polymerase specialized sigma24 family protein